MLLAATAPAFIRPDEPGQGSDMLDQQQQNFRALARRFAEDDLLPGAAQRDREAQFPGRAFGAMAKLGLMGMLAPPEFGGMGLGAGE